MVHGDANEMGRLKQSLIQKYEDKSIQVYSPKNGQKIQLTFKAEKMVKAVGSLASKPAEDGTNLSGVLVMKDFESHLMAVNDLSNFTELTIGAISQNLIVPFRGNIEDLKHHLSQMYESVIDSSKTSFKVRYLN